MPFSLSPHSLENFPGKPGINFNPREAFRSEMCARSGCFHFIFILTNLRARVLNHQRAFHTAVPLMWACNTNAWNGEVCFPVAVVCRLGVVEARAVPAERRGSCCFLLGIVSVTFLGASHAGITGVWSLSVVKMHPARRCDGVLSSLSGTRRRLVFRPPALLRS